MTDIVNIPEGILSSDFPTNADRTAGVFNQKSYDWSVSARAMSARDREIAVAGRTNALAAKEQAQAAAGSATAADGHANRATSAADAAMGYRDTAGQHAGTAATHAGTAATKAGEASASAQLAGEHKQQALQAVADAQTQVGLASAQAQRAEAAAESIAGGPITSLQVHSGLKTGAVSLGLADLGPKATDAQMQAGTVTDPLLMSPAGVRASVLANAPKTLLRSARTSNVQLVKADNGKLIDITSGTFTQTFAAAATLGDGWSCYLKNGGAGDITLDPNASETIDGLTSYIMYPGEVRLVQCDGVALRTVVLNGFYKVFTASGNFIKPPGYSIFSGLAFSGGQSGSRSGSTSTTAYGGRGGGCFPFQIASNAFSASTSFTVGAGGVPSASPSQNAGGNTTIGSLLTVYGAGVVDPGTPGSVLRIVAAGGAFAGANIGSSGDLLSSVYGGGNVNFSSSEQGSSVYGGAAGGCVSNSGSTVSTAGTSTFAGNGGAASSAGPGADGAIPGGGGGATQTGATSGAGARGELRIWGII